ncbi:MAG: hypothetical protein HY064_15045 [Bacteroidetes bacterium]|nr:hypothetical protein [Bacteroidota bacterium]
MNEFPNTKEAADIILEIIRTARNRIILISPFVDPSDNFFAELEKASSLGKSILLVCIENKLKDEVKGKLSRMKNLEILNHEDVHAKCYYNEELLISTSLNLSRYSEQHNIENSTVFKKTENPDRFYRASAQPEMIVRDAISRIPRSNEFAKKKIFTPINSYNYDNLKLTFFKPIPDQKGVCIRCGDGVNYLNGNFPLCSTHYNVWAIYNDWNYKENFCHWCKTETPTSKRKPFCISCFRKYEEFANPNIELNNKRKPKSEPPSPQEMPPISKKDAVEKSKPIIEVPRANSSISSDENKSTKKYLTTSIIVIVLSLGAWVLFNYFKSDSPIIKNHDDVLKEIVHNYYSDLNNPTIRVSKYFSPAVENYFKVKNITPAGVDSLINVGTKEFMYGESKIIDSTFAISKDPRGNIAVGFWVNFKCFRVSKVQYEKCKVHEEFVFDKNDKIISVNEIKIQDLKFSFKNSD